MTTTATKRQHTIPIAAKVERGLKHATIDRQLSVSATVLVAIMNRVEHDGRLNHGEPKHPSGRRTS